MAMNKPLLFKKIKSALIKHADKIDFDLELILILIEKTIFNDPKKNCLIRGSKMDWSGLPKTKSLSHARKNFGLPIGNLTSQLFGNIYLNEFDHFVKRDLQIRFYGRYVDDFILIHHNKEYLKSLIEPIREFLYQNLQLKLHPDKIYLQHFAKGVKYLGAVIRPYRIYIADRTKGNFFRAIEQQNAIARNQKPTKEELESFLSSMNSYLGILKHYKTYKLRKKMIKENLSAWWWNSMYLTGGYSKFVKKRKNYVG